jgi:NTE family protein
MGDGVLSTVLHRQGMRSSVRIALVLSGGGLRGAGHLGVLRRLVDSRVPIDVIVGSSAGAVVAAYYASVGLTVDALIDDARHFRGRHLMAHSLNVHLQQGGNRTLAELSGIIPTRLAQLERASFERLHHGIRGIGIVCHDTMAGHATYFSTGDDRGACLSDVVRASASLPLVFPPVPVRCGDELLLLKDGGLSDCLPIDFARRPPLSATHLIVSDCRWFARSAPPADDRLTYIRPRLLRTGTLWASATLLSAVRAGATAVTDEMIERISNWNSHAV